MKSQRTEKTTFEAYRKLATMTASRHKWWPCLGEQVDQGTAGVKGSIPTDNNVCTQVTISIKVSIK